MESAEPENINSINIGAAFLHFVKISRQLLQFIYCRHWLSEKMPIVIMKKQKKK